MKRFFTKQNLLRAVSYILVAALASAATWFIAPRTNKLENLATIIENRFIGEVDETYMEDAAAAAMVASLGDMWSSYIPASVYGAHVENQNNEYVGIGISILERDDGQGVEIVDVTAGGPAEEAGLLPGDIITQVDGQSVMGADTTTLQNLILGEKNTRVTIIVLRGEESMEFTVTRKGIHTKVSAGIMLNEEVGYVVIANFYNQAGEDTIEVIEDLLSQGAEALVFDVRNNPGGYIDEMLEILDYLLPEGDLLHSVDNNGWKDVDRSDAGCLELPMAVLINGQSYSCAEIFAAVLHEYDWALTVGEPTIGKSYYQNTIELGDGSAVLLSVGAFTTPKDVNLTEAGGLVPDVPVEPGEEAVIEWSDDLQLRAAVEALIQENQ